MKARRPRRARGGGRRRDGAPGHAGVCREEAPLGIVAAGSGNDGAITLDLPIHDIPAAVQPHRGWARGRRRRRRPGQDLRAGHRVARRARYFLAVLSAASTPRSRRTRGNINFPRGPLKYKVATIREIPRYKPYGVTVTADGQTWTQRAHLVAVANSPVFGGGLIISPESSSDRRHARARDHGATRQARDRQALPQALRRVDPRMSPRSGSFAPRRSRSHRPRAGEAAAGLRRRRARGRRSADDRGRAPRRCASWARVRARLAG